MALEPWQRSPSRLWWSVDPAGVVVMANAAATYALLGLAPDAVVGRPLRDLVDEPPAAEALLRAARRDEVVPPRVLRLLRAGGGAVAVETDAVARRSPDGAYLGAAGCAVPLPPYDDRSYLAAAVTAMPGIFFILDERGRLELVNDAFCVITGRTPERLRAAEPHELFAADEFPRVREAIDRAFRDGRARVEASLLDPHGGGTRRFLFSMTTMTYGGRPRLVGTGLDVSALREESSRFRALTEAAHDVTMLLDPRGVVRYLSPSVEHALGWGPSELLGRRAIELLHPEERREVPDAFRALLADGEAGRPIEHRLRGRDETYRWFETIVVDCRDVPGIEAFVARSRDVHERREAFARVAAASRYDELTGLLTRAALRRELPPLLARGGQGAVLFVDLDDFKAVNDAYGHGAGDVVLRDVAARLAGGIRDGDAIYRLGGDEFVVVAHRATRDDAEGVARRLVAALGAPLVVEEAAVRVTPSIGIAVYPDDAADADALLAAADAAMYRCKREGRAGYRFVSEPGTASRPQRAGPVAALHGVETAHGRTQTFRDGSESRGKP